ncbi:MgtC/SapB family protein [uncultured Bifidobacterium sp.]|uniref:MgtC/SapB family protein n=1 Tax=uncultured Bifidobacterium sp. TaxID=165187 RepID=UPI0026271A00|nr:MgtC/SapB family protein [uncultured Bifidobacterium sp.]
MTTWMVTPAELVDIAAALVLTGLVGFEREARRKDAGIRTHILVGLASCLFTLISIRGIPALMGSGVTWDASRIASQVVVGIGFLGAGVIFFNNDTVRGLTTASAVWMAAAVGVACGAGMIGAAALVVALYFLVVFAVAPLTSLILRRDQDHLLRLTYEDGRGALRQTLLLADGQGFDARIVSTRDIHRDDWDGAGVDIRVSGKGDLQAFITAVAETDGVHDIDLLDRDD